MNRNHAKMGERKPETGAQSATPAASPVSDFRSPLSQRASSLITTLLVLVVLSTIVVAFMQSMSVERSVAKSVKNKLQATLLADAAMDVAVQRLKTTTSNGPYGAIFGSDQSSNSYLCLAKRETTSTNTVTHRIPLFSTVTPVASFDDLSVAQIDTNSRTISDLEGSGASVSRTLSAPGDLVCNLNVSNSTFPTGLVGLTSGSALMPLPVNWIYVNDKSGRVVGRYAFWVDDECSKIDLRYAGQPANASGTHSRGAGTNSSEVSLRVLTNTPVSLQTSYILNLLALRNVTNMPAVSSYVQYALPGGGTVVPTNSWSALRPYVTIYSLNDDRSPDGKRRLNLNSVVTSTNTAARVEKEVFAIRDAITNNLPNFGMRYYSSPSTPTVADQAVYATKISANIRDFIDTNSVATIIQSDGTAFTTNSPGFIPYETLQGDLPMAFGKEAGPFLSEYFRIVRVISPNPHPAAGPTLIPLVVRFGHYIELHNPSGRAISSSDLGADPCVILSNRFSWNNSDPSGSPSVLRLADVKIHLPIAFSIPAGGYAVLTTDGPPWRDGQSDYIGSSANRYLITRGNGPGQWELINTGGKQPSDPSSNFEDYLVTTRAITVSSKPNYGFQNAATSATYSDQRERLALANDTGIIDMQLRIYTGQSLYFGRDTRNPTWNSTFLADPNTSNRNTPNDQASEPRFTRGDVRSNTEISAIGANNSSACWKQGNSGAYGDTLSSGPQQTIGASNINTMQNTQTGSARWQQWWYEYTDDSAGNHFVKGAPLVSLGELGSIYDPVRHDISGFRSQGATLRIGQADSPTNNRANANSSDTNSINWLGGRGSDDVASTNYSKNAFLLMDVFRTDDVTEGRINPNSIVRDPSGLVLRAVLDGFVFESSSTNQASAALSGAPLDATNAIASLRSFATNSTNGFLVSVGDLSRAPLFWTATNALAGVSMQGVSDAGREEFMRRSANLLSTQSLAFSVYIRAEAGTFVRGVTGVDRFRVTATAARETVVQLRPMYAPVADPTIPAAPTNWSIVKPRSISY